MIARHELGLFELYIQHWLRRVKLFTDFPLESRWFLFFTRRCAASRGISPRGAALPSAYVLAPRLSPAERIPARAHTALVQLLQARCDILVASVEFEVGTVPQSAARVGLCSIMYRARRIKVLSPVSPFVCLLPSPA